MQTKCQSMIEVLTNTFVGMMGSWIITMTTLYFIKSMVVAATVTTVLCTVWSIVRGYAIRRHFNKDHHEMGTNKPSTSAVNASEEKPLEYY